MAERVAWPEQRASPAKVGSLKVAWCIAPMAAPRDAQGWKGNRDRLGRQGL